MCSGLFNVWKPAVGSHVLNGHSLQRNWWHGHGGHHDHDCFQQLSRQCQRHRQLRHQAPTPTTNPDTNGDADSDTNGDADSDTNGDANSDANGDANSDAHGDADSDAHGDADPKSGLRALNKSFEWYCSA